jgi:hypothetical protein
MSSSGTVATAPDGKLVGDGMTVEVLRVCTDGTPNACRFLYQTGNQTP